MTNIKVTYGSIVRRLNISTTTTWSELENQFRNLFSIPQEIPIAVTYIDEDGDVITLSSDLELQEVLDNSSNNANTIKFALTIPNMNNLNNREISIDTVIDEEETSNLINGLSAIQIKESNNDNNNNNDNVDNDISNVKHVTITDEVDDPLFNQQRETLGENSKNATKSINVQENNNSEGNGNGNQENSDDDEHEIIVIITRNPWSHRRRARFGGRNPYYYPCVGRFRYGCHPEQGQGQGQGGHGGHGGHGHNHGGYNHGGYNRSGFRGHGCGRYFRRHHQQMSPEDVIEKINTLHSMGFVEGDLEGLVKRYNGNLEFVIESLLLNKQNEQNSEVSNEEVVRKENGEKDQPMEVEEESGPYVL